LGFALTILGIGFLYTYRYVKGMHSPHDPVFGLIAMMDGTAAKPFIYRDLLGVTTRGLDSALPSFTPSDVFARALVKFQRLTGHELRLCTLAVWQTLFAYALYGVSLLFIGSKILKLNLVGQCGLVLVGMMVPIFWIYDRTFFLESYDAVTLCIAGWLTALWLGRRYLSFAVLLVFGIFTKESLAVFCFLPLANLAVERKFKEFGTGLVAVVLAYLVIHGILHSIYRGSPGPELEVAENHGGPTAPFASWYLMRNLELLVPTSGDSLRFYLRILVPIVPLVFAMKRLDVSLRIGVIATSAFFLLSVALLGRFVEMRVFFEIVPLWIAVIFGAFLKGGGFVRAGGS